jgi:hypothetical protein
MKSAGESVGLSSVSAGAGISAVGSAASSVIDLVAQGISYMYQSKVMDIQAEMQKGNFQFQMDSAQIDTEAKVDLITAEMEKQQIQVDGQKLLDASIQNRAKAEGELSIQKAIKKDAETTKKFAETKVSKATIAKMFQDPRETPFYGTPVG